MDRAAAVAVLVALVGCERSPAAPAATVAPRATAPGATVATPATAPGATVAAPRPAGCARCVPEPGGGCASHSVSPCRWVLNAPDDPIDVVLPCEASCCPDRTSPEMCPEFTVDAAVTSGPLCPTRQPDGSVRGQVAWRDDVISVLVLAQAPGLVTTASQHSALIDHDGRWTMKDVPAGAVTFSFYGGGLRSRTTCTLPR